MYALPDVDEVVAVAKELGIHLGPEEVGLYRRYLLEQLKELVEDNLTAMTRGVSRNTQPFNYTGHPALALPVGKSSAGLPISMQLVGRFFDDPLLMRVAYAYQHATDWDKITGVHA
jgi:Asp-tRNA(Asn)/Glu-tRNA(Gln) amidotransferase A subunit family amidase